MTKDEALNILSLSNNANENDIKKRYKELAKLYHPDSNTPESSAEKFILITEAYLFLLNKNTLITNSTSNQTTQQYEDIYREQAKAYARMKYEEFKKKEEEIHNISINKILYPSWLNIIFLILTVFFLFDYYLPRQWTKCQDAYIIEPISDEDDFIIKACNHKILAERLSLNDIYLLEKNGVIYLNRTRLLRIICSYSINPQRRVYNVTNNRYITYPTLWLSLLSSLSVLLIPFRNFQQKLFAKFLSLVFILSFLFPFVAIGFAMIV